MSKGNDSRFNLQRRTKNMLRQLDDNASQVEQIITHALRTQHKVDQLVAHILVILNNIKRASDFLTGENLKQVLARDTEHLAAATAAYQAFVNQTGAHTQEKLDSTVRLVSGMQDAIAAALKGDGGVALKQHIQKHNPNAIESTLIDLGGRPEGMTPARLSLALAVKEQRQRRGKQDYWVIGKDLITLWLAMPEQLRTEEIAINLKKLLRYTTQSPDGGWFVNDKQGMASYLRDLMRDYKEREEQKQGVGKRVLPTRNE